MEISPEFLKEPRQKIKRTVGKEAVDEGAIFVHAKIKKLFLHGCWLDGDS